MFSRFGRASGALLLCAAAMACGEPPTKEMDLARQALETARSVQAERYAPDELTAAQTAMDKSTAAVSNRDFKLALNHALDSHERAQAASSLATAAHRELRERLDASLTDVTSRLASARATVGAAARARSSRRAAAKAGRTLDTIEKDLQKAGALVSADDLDAADALLGRVSVRVTEVLGTLPAAARKS